jgi:hypothetical protein
MAFIWIDHLLRTEYNMTQKVQINGLVLCRRSRPIGAGVTVSVATPLLTPGRDTDWLTPLIGRLADGREIL